MVENIAIAHYVLLLTLDQVPATQCESPSDCEYSQSGFWQTLESMTLVGTGDEHADSAAFIVNAELMCCLHTMSLVWIPRPQLTEQGLQSVIAHLKICSALLYNRLGNARYSLIAYCASHGFTLHRST